MCREEKTNALPCRTPLTAVRCVVAFLMFLFPHITHAQTNDWLWDFQNRTPSRLTLGVQGELANARLSNTAYSAAKFFLQYERRSWRLAAMVNANAAQRFQIARGNLIINLPDGATVRGLTIPNDTYELQAPVALSLSMFGERFGGTLLLSALTQEAVMNMPMLTEREGVLFVDAQTTRQLTTQALLGIRGFATVGMFRIHAGVLPTSFWRRGDDLMMQSAFRMNPFLEVEFLGGLLSGGASGSRESVGAFGIARFENFFSASLPSIEFSLRAKRIVNFNAQSLQLDAGIPISSSISLTVGAEHWWYPTERFSRADFGAWLNAKSFNSTFTSSNDLQSTSLRVGAVFKIGSSAVAPQLRLLDAKLFQANLYQSKRAFYASNPIAALTLHNAEEKTLRCQLVASAANGIGTFKSEAFTIAPDEIKDMPLFLYLSDEKLKPLSQATQITISVVADGEELALTSLPVTCYNPNAWDGDTYSLKMFVAPNDEFIMSNAKSTYLSSLQPDGATSGNMKFERLKAFLSALGKPLSYLPDATTSLVIDQVQYPRETLEKQTGDCEDLVVFTASSLMSVGMNCAIMDLRPKREEAITVPTADPESIGHVFLLVDTGIDPNRLPELGLTEFQAVTRKNPLGKNTLWLPIETTVLNKGFDEALKLGAKQYYMEVIEKSGIEKGNVHIYDF
jgi:hypothetical protein